MHVGYYLLLSVCLRHGFLRLIQGCLRLVPDSALHAGPPCSSWIWLNRGTSGRSVNKVMGDTSQPSVLESNMNLACILKKNANSNQFQYLIKMNELKLRIMSRFALISILCICRCVHVTIEQPRSSIMKHVKYFKFIARTLGRRVAWKLVN